MFCLTDWTNFIYRAHISEDVSVNNDSTIIVYFSSCNVIVWGGGNIFSDRLLDVGFHTRDVSIVGMSWVIKSCSFPYIAAIVGIVSRISFTVYRLCEYYRPKISQNLRSDGNASLMNLMENNDCAFYSPTGRFVSIKFWQRHRWIVFKKTYL